VAHLDATAFKEGEEDEERINRRAQEEPPVCGSDMQLGWKQLRRQNRRFQVTREYVWAALTPAKTASPANHELRGALYQFSS
jgi:hypothetical protein